MRERTLAFHEAAHAVVALAVGLDVHIATIESGSESAGHVSHGLIGKCWTGELICMVLAGPVAAAITAGRPLSPTVSGTDLDHAMAMIDVQLASAALLRSPYDGIAADNEPDALLQHWLAVTRRVVLNHWCWIVDTATELMRQRTLTGEQVLQLRSVEGRQPSVEELDDLVRQESGFDPARPGHRSDAKAGQIERLVRQAEEIATNHLVKQIERLQVRARECGVARDDIEAVADEGRRAIVDWLPKFRQELEAQLTGKER